MKRGDEEHQKLLHEAGKHRLDCETCYRHVNLANSHMQLSPANLLRHLKYTHGYKAKSWWQFWK